MLLGLSPLTEIVQKIEEEQIERVQTKIRDNQPLTQGEQAFVFKVFARLSHENKIAYVKRHTKFVLNLIIQTQEISEEMIAIFHEPIFTLKGRTDFTKQIYQRIKECPSFLNLKVFNQLYFLLDRAYLRDLITSELGGFSSQLLSVIIKKREVFSIFSVEMKTALEQRYQSALVHDFKNLLAQPVPKDSSSEDHSVLIQQYQSLFSAMNVASRQDCTVAFFEKLKEDPMFLPKDIWLSLLPHLDPNILVIEDLDWLVRYPSFLTHRLFEYFSLAGIDIFRLLDQMKDLDLDQEGIPSFLKFLVQLNIAAHLSNKSEKDITPNEQEFKIHHMNGFMKEFRIQCQRWGQNLFSAYGNGAPFSKEQMVVIERLADMVAVPKNLSNFSLPSGVSDLLQIQRRLNLCYGEAHLSRKRQDPKRDPKPEATLQLVSLYPQAAKDQLTKGLLEAFETYPESEGISLDFIQLFSQLNGALIQQWFVRQNPLHASIAGRLLNSSMWKRWPDSIKEKIVSALKPGAMIPPDIYEEMLSRYRPAIPPDEKYHLIQLGLSSSLCAQQVRTFFGKNENELTLFLQTLVDKKEWVFLERLLESQNTFIYTVVHKTLSSDAKYLFISGLKTEERFNNIMRGYFEMYPDELIQFFNQAKNKRAELENDRGIKANDFIVRLEENRLLIHKLSSLLNRRLPITRLLQYTKDEEEKQRYNVIRYGLSNPHLVKDVRAFFAKQKNEKGLLDFLRQLIFDKEFCLLSKLLESPRTHIHTVFHSVSVEGRYEFISYALSRGVYRNTMDAYFEAYPEDLEVVVQKAVADKNLPVLRNLLGIQNINLRKRVSQRISEEFKKLGNDFIKKWPALFELTINKGGYLPLMAPIYSVKSKDSNICTVVENGNDLVYSIYSLDLAKELFVSYLNAFPNALKKLPLSNNYKTLLDLLRPYLYEDKKRLSRRELVSKLEALSQRPSADVDAYLEYCEITLEGDAFQAALNDLFIKARNEQMDQTHLSLAVQYYDSLVVFDQMEIERISAAQMQAAVGLVVSLPSTPISENESGDEADAAASQGLSMRREMSQIPIVNAVDLVEADELVRGQKNMRPPNSPHTPDSSIDSDKRPSSPMDEKPLMEKIRNGVGLSSSEIQYIQEKVEGRDSPKTPDIAGIGPEADMDCFIQFCRILKEIYSSIENTENPFVMTPEMNQIITATPICFRDQAIDVVFNTLVCPEGWDHFSRKIQNFEPFSNEEIMFIRALMQLDMCPLCDLKYHLERREFYRCVQQCQYIKGIIEQLLKNPAAFENDLPISFTKYDPLVVPFIFRAFKFYEDPHSFRVLNCSHLWRQFNLDEQKSILQNAPSDELISTWLSHLNLDMAYFFSLIAENENHLDALYRYLKNIDNHEKSLRFLESMAAPSEASYSFDFDKVLLTDDLQQIRPQFTAFVENHPELLRKAPFSVLQPYVIQKCDVMVASPVMQSKRSHSFVIWFRNFLAPFQSFWVNAIRWIFPVLSSYAVSMRDQLTKVQLFSLLLNAKKVETICELEKDSQLMKLLDVSDKVTIYLQNENYRKAHERDAYQWLREGLNKENIENVVFYLEPSQLMKLLLDDSLFFLLPEETSSVVPAYLSHKNFRVARRMVFEQLNGSSQIQNESIENFVKDAEAFYAYRPVFNKHHPQHGLYWKAYDRWVMQFIETLKTIGENDGLNVFKILAAIDETLLDKHRTKFLEFFTLDNLYKFSVAFSKHPHEILALPHLDPVRQIFRAAVQKCYASASTDGSGLISENIIKNFGPLLGRNTIPTSYLDKFERKQDSVSAAAAVGLWGTKLRTGRGKTSGQDVSPSTGKYLPVP